MNKFDPSINTIHCDMDGVVADFDAYVLKHMGRTFSHQAGPGADKEMWDFLSGIDRIYYVIEPTPYAKRLWDAIKAVGCNRQMLTAIPRRASIPTAEIDKIEWANEKHNDVFGEQVKVVIGPFSRDKWKHAKPGDILIDDREDNIAEWIEAGGIGILHHYNDIERTLALLNQHAS